MYVVFCFFLFLQKIRKKLQKRGAVADMRLMMPQFCA